LRSAPLARSAASGVGMRGGRARRRGVFPRRARAAAAGAASRLAAARRRPPAERAAGDALDGGGARDDLPGPPRRDAHARARVSPAPRPLARERAALRLVLLAAPPRRAPRSLPRARRGD